MEKLTHIHMLSLSSPRIYNIDIITVMVLCWGSVPTKKPQKDNVSSLIRHELRAYISENLVSVLVVDHV